MNKKVKRSVEKITMPEDVKERIISNCEAAIDNKAENGRYTDHVYKIEHVQNHNIRRIISGIAACAVLAGGIGVSAHLMKKQPSPSSLKAAPEEITSESTSAPEATAATESPTEIAEPATLKQLDPLIEEFLSKDFRVMTPTFDINGEQNGSSEQAISNEERAKVIETLRKYDFIEITEEEFQPKKDAGISLTYRSDYEKSPYEQDNLIFYKDGYACVLIDVYEIESEPYKNIRYDWKYFRCPDAESIINELLNLDSICYLSAPFSDFRSVEFTVADAGPGEALRAYTGEYPRYIDMSEVFPDREQNTVSVNPYVWTLTEEERNELAVFFDHADYKELTDFTDLPETSTKESISFVYLDDQQMVGITIHNNGLIEYKYIPFTWDKSSPFAVADNERYEESYYLVDYQEFRDKIVEVLGEEVVLKIDTSYETPPFGHLTDYDLNSYQSLGVDWAMGVPAEAVVSVEAYINAHHWTEVSQPIENAINSEKSENSFVTLYNSLYGGGVDCSFAFFNGGYISKLTSDGTETWYKCIEEDDIAVGVDNIITSYTNNNTNNN